MSKLHSSQDPKQNPILSKNQENHSLAFSFETVLADTTPIDADNVKCTDQLVAFFFITVMLSCAGMLRSNSNCFKESTSAFKHFVKFSTF